MTWARVTCSSISNTGKLSTQAAQVVLLRKPGQYIWMHVRQSSMTLQTGIGCADELIAIDGCGDCCAKKKLSSSRITPNNHIIAADPGIEKKGMGEVQYEEIETVVGPS